MGLAQNLMESDEGHVRIRDVFFSPQRCKNQLHDSNLETKEFAAIAIRDKGTDDPEACSREMRWDAGELSGEKNGRWALKILQDF